MEAAEDNNVSFQEDPDGPGHEWQRWQWEKLWKWDEGWGGESWTKERLLKMEYIQFPVFEWLNPKELYFVVIFF